MEIARLNEKAFKAAVNDMNAEHHVNRRSCPCNDQGSCQYYNVMCDSVPKDWDHCIVQQG